MYLPGRLSADGDEIDVPNGMNNCCQVWNCLQLDLALRSVRTYDPDYSATGGCDMSCTPIDSGVLFLLIGGGLFGGFMIKRRRETELMPLAAK